MNPDTTMQELWNIKDERSQRFGGDVRAMCRDLMEKQQTKHSNMPLVRDLKASQEAQCARIAKLPQPVEGDVLLPDDPIIAELHAIRAASFQEQSARTAVLHEDPPQYENPDEA